MHMMSRWWLVEGGRCKNVTGLVITFRLQTWSIPMHSIESVISLTVNGLELGEWQSIEIT